MPGRVDSAVRRSREDPNAFARQLFAGLPQRYDLLEEALSFGQNRRWRMALVDAIAESRPRTVLDVATGTAGVALALAARTGAEITGVDLTEAMLRQGQTRVDRLDERRVRLAVARAERLPFADDAFDAVSFTYLLRYVADPAATLRELARVVRPGGTVASLEFAVPPPPVWRSAWRLYTRLVLPAAGLATGGREWARVGRFLGPSIEEHYRRYPVERHVTMWQEAGLEDVRVRTMSLGGGLVMHGRRTGG
ncbi:class I SAM-dependent methyltransferase [Nocardioides sp. CER19]|uniref:class I SAM-dependent methyltransferase n=1 Tax=Nocardioides sp. CER19 TaxID=3038538 RepID=UPI00244C4CA5|nr:class I SAM-dependent methyltransferase [Nocardioides sp. CER19]MDH2414971.1 class I SAM-dependent methyltransferase [Nocardioides sp. CER19]